MEEVKKDEQNKENDSLKDIEDKGEEKENLKSKNFEEKQNKQLIYILVALGFLTIFLLSFAHFRNSIGEFEVEGITFKKIRQGQIDFYHTHFLIRGITGKSVSKIDYNVFLRKDPRLTSEIPVEGEIDFLEHMVINGTTSFNCEGDQVIAIANMNQVLSVLGTKLSRDPSASCDNQGRYMYVNFIESETEGPKIVKTGNSCYNVYASDCEILDVTERIILEAIKNK